MVCWAIAGYRLRGRGDLRDIAEEAVHRTYIKLSARADAPAFVIDPDQSFDAYIKRVAKGETNELIDEVNPSHLIDPRPDSGWRQKQKLLDQDPELDARTAEALVYVAEQWDLPRLKAMIMAFDDNYTDEDIGRILDLGSRGRVSEQVLEVLEDLFDKMDIKLDPRRRRMPRRREEPEPMGERP